MKIINLKLQIASVMAVAIHFLVANFLPVWSFILSSDDLRIELKGIEAVLLLCIAAGLVLSLIFAINLLTGRLFLLLINFVGILYSYYALVFGIRISDEIMVSMLFFAEPNDITSSFDWRIFVIVPILFSFTWYLSNKVLKYFDAFAPFSWNGFRNNFPRNLKQSALSGVTSLLLLTVFIGGAAYFSDLSLLTYKLRTVAEQAMPSYVLARKTNIEKLAKVLQQDIVLDDYQDAGMERAPTADGEDPLVVILVIGESLRSNRLGINGYERDTTPKMEKIDNLFSFKDVLSCSTTTSVSLPCMLTDEPLEGWIEKFSTGTNKNKYSVAKIFTDLGFDSYFLSTANKDYSMYVQKDFQGTKNVMLSNELRRKYIMSNSDYSDALLAMEIDNNVKQDTMYMLGTMGSHRDYFSRYPRDMAVFTPDIGTSLENINNAYDNTVVYFDSLISSITEKFKDNKALLIYMSDHGQSLGENGIFLHGAKVATAPKEQRNVPMIAWVSDKYIEAYPEKYENIQKWLKVNNSKKAGVTHDFLFHSILDCSGITSKFDRIDNNLSICQNPVDTTVK